MGEGLTGPGHAIILRHMSNAERINIERLAEMFRALSNPNRLRIFLRLLTCCAPSPDSQDASPPGARCAVIREASRSVGDLGGELEVKAPTVSHHIKELRQSGLIRVGRSGKHVLCCVDPGALEEIARLLGVAGASQAGRELSPAAEQNDA